MKAVRRAMADVAAALAALDARIRHLETIPCDNPAQGGERIAAMVRLHTRRITLSSRRELLRTYGELLETTPARSGRARAGWVLSTTGECPEPPPFPDPDTYDADRVEAAVAESLRTVAALAESETTELCLGNGLEYLPQLEAGLSTQAAGFVASAVAGLEARLQALGRSS